MPRPPKTREQSAWINGYEPGSIMAKASRAEQKALRERLKQDEREAKAFENTARAAGWTCARSRSQRSMSEV